MKVTAHFLDGKNITFNKTEVIAGPQYWELKQDNKTILVTANMLVIEEDEAEGSVTDMLL